MGLHVTQELERSRKFSFLNVPVFQAIPHTLPQLTVCRKEWWNSVTSLLCSYSKPQHVQEKGLLLAQSTGQASLSLLLTQCAGCRPNYSHLGQDLVMATSGGPEGQDTPQHSYTCPTASLSSVDGDFGWIRESVDVRGNVIVSVLPLSLPPFTALCKGLGLNRFPTVFYGTLSQGSRRYPSPSLYRCFL